MNIFRSMYSKIFGRNPTPAAEPVNLVRFVSLNQDVNLAQAGGAESYQNLFTRVCIDCLAENAAKLKPKVQRIIDGGIKDGDSRLQALLEISPNEYMNSFEFIYKVVTLWAKDNNAFIYIAKDLRGNPIGLYPIAYAQAEFLESNKMLFVRFTFVNGFRMTVPYEELCHLRRFFGPSDLFGEDNERTLKPQIGLLNIVNKGFAAAVNNNNRLKGIIKSNVNLHNDDLKKQQEAFVKDYMNLSNNGGIAALDTRTEYIELKNQPTVADDKQMEVVRKDIMAYFHVSEDILMARYNEEQWGAFYESVIEPIAIRLGLELTRKIFTQREIAVGNRIHFEANRLQYASTSSKITLTKELMPFGMLSVNEAREIFNLAPVEGGEKRLVSLNYIDAELANQYQAGKIGAEQVEGGEKE